MFKILGSVFIYFFWKKLLLLFSNDAFKLIKRDTEDIYNVSKKIIFQ